MSKNRPPQSAPDSTSPQRFTRLKILLGLMVVVAIAVLFAPAILMNTPLKQAAIDYATADLKGSLAVSSGSAGWFSPIELRGVILRDNGGQEIATIDSINTSQSLLSLLFSTDYGTIDLKAPTLDLLLRSDGSNLEDALAVYLAPSEESNSGALPQATVTISDGIVRCQAEALEEAEVFDALNGKIELRGGRAAVAVEIQCHAGEQIDQGTLALNVAMDAGSEVVRGETIEAQVNAKQFPLRSLAPVLNRVLGPVNCVGQLDGAVTITGNLQQQTADILVESLNAMDVVVIAPQWIGSDQFKTRRLTATGSLQLTPQHITATQFKTETDFAQIQADGQFDLLQWEQWASGATGTLPAFQMDGAFDLAQISAMLPETTRMRQGARINSGILRVQANTRDENGSGRVVINADTANVNVQANGQNIVWQQPLRVVGVAGQDQGRWFLQDLRLQSEFFSATGFAALDRGQLKVQGDLAQVLNQLGQVVELGTFRVAGKMDGQLQWQLPAGVNSTPATVDSGMPLELTGRFKIQNPVIALPGQPEWRQSEVELSLSGDAVAMANGKMAIDAANFDIRLGTELLSGQLNGRVDDVWRVGKYRFNCRASGSLGQWLAHARNFSEFPDFQADGKLSAQFVLAMGSRATRLNQLRFEAQDFQFNGFAMNIHEPNVSGRTNLKYEYATSALSLTQATITSSSVAAQTESLTFLMAPKIVADGFVAVRANANRASNWWGFSLPGDSIRWDGSATGQVQFSSESGFFGGDIKATVDDFVLFQEATVANEAGVLQQVSQATAYEEVWRESQLRMSTQFFLDDDFNAVRFRALDFASQLADVQAKGAIGDLSKTMQLEMKGRWNVHWEQINAWILETAGEGIAFSGGGWRPLEILGPLYPVSAGGPEYADAWVPTHLSAATSLVWQNAQAFNVPLGRAKLDVRLEQAQAHVSSTSRKNLAGQIAQVKPVIDLRQAEPQMVLAQGRLLNNWQVRPQDSRSWLKYAAPLIADATSAEGVVSIDLQGAQIPLLTPQNASAQGVLRIHQLTVGAGPLAQQMLPLIDQIRTLLNPDRTSPTRTSDWIQLKSQDLPLAVQNGRVFHENFTFNYKDVDIRIRGSVGFDQTLNLVAEIPILDQWVEKEKLLQGLRGQSISIPISGTLSKPKLDARVIAQLSQQLVRNAAVGAVNEKVSSEVGKFQDKANQRVQDEVNRFQNKVQTELKDKLQDELKGLFGRGRKDGG